MSITFLNDSICAGVFGGLFFFGTDCFTAALCSAVTGSEIDSFFYFVLHKGSVSAFCCSNSLIYFSNSCEFIRLNTTNLRRKHREKLEFLDTNRSNKNS